MLNIFIGYDQREAIAWHVLAHSILTRMSEPVNIVPLRQDTLRKCGIYWREPDALASTEFSLTRFLVPYMSGYEGYSLYMDCDMLCQVDIAELFEIGYRDPSKAVWVVQHYYQPKYSIKMDGKAQTMYPCKNWSSLMLFNNAACRMLNPKNIQLYTPAQLHRFDWLLNSDIGRLDRTWNWLVGDYDPEPGAKILHYTNGGPWFGVQHGSATESQRWDNELATLTGAKNFAREMVSS